MPKKEPLETIVQSRLRSRRETGSGISVPHPFSVGCTYPNTSLSPTCVTFGLSSDYGFKSAREAHDWFLGMMRDHEEFAVEPDEPGELPMPFWSETVRQVLVE